ncbi:MAG TPA: hypothetical protein VGG16_13610 [Streptosporangiaceae bacterium]
MSATTISVPAFFHTLSGPSVIPETIQVATPSAAAETSSRIRRYLMTVHHM